LYDCARPDAVVGVGEGRALYIGSLGRVDWHVHGTAALVAGMAGRIRLGLAGGQWLRCHAAVIPAGVAHTLELNGNPLAVLYVEPQIASISGLAHLGTHWESQGDVLIGRCIALEMFHEIYQNRHSLTYAAEALDDLLRFAQTGDRAIVDPRLHRVIRKLADDPRDMTPLDVFARHEGVSRRELMALFRRDMGVRFRQFRIWNRLRAATQVALSGRNLTEAAHAVGFTDSAHYARQYHEMFGVTPSSVLRRVARIGRLDRRRDRSIA